MEMCKKWEAERLERVEKRCQEEAVENQWQEEQQRRLAAERREERERKLERARRAKAAMEENPDALRKGKWPRCTQKNACFHWASLASNELFWSTDVVLSCNELLGVCCLLFMSVLVLSCTELFGELSCTLVLICCHHSMFQYTFVFLWHLI